MNTSELANKWADMKEKIKKTYPELTEKDLEYEIGKEEELLLRLQQKLNKTREEINKWLSMMG